MTTDPILIFDAYRENVLFELLDMILSGGGHGEVLLKAEEISGHLGLDLILPTGKYLRPGSLMDSPDRFVGTPNE